MLVIADPLTTTDDGVLGAATGGDRRWLEVRARRLVEAGADALDLNASNLGPQEAAVLGWMAEIVEAVVDVPLSLDGPQPRVLADVARGRRLPPILNSWSLDQPIAADLLETLGREGTRLVVQLRRGQRLPRDGRERSDWADEAVERWAPHGVQVDRMLLDGVALPWGDDLAAGRGLLEFVAGSAAEHPERTTLVGLGNVGHGTAAPLDAQRKWLEILREAGLGAVLLDPTRRELHPLLRG